MLYVYSTVMCRVALLQIHVIQDKLMFFLDNPRTASQLKRLSRVDVDNDSLIIRVFPSPPPRREST